LFIKAYRFFHCFLSLSLFTVAAEPHRWGVQEPAPAQPSAPSAAFFSEEGFQAQLDAHYFRGDNEIKVRNEGLNIVIEGQHMPRDDGLGTVERFFKRTYEMPKNIDVLKVSSNRSSDGILTVKAPMYVKPKPLESKEVKVENSNYDARLQGDKGAKQ